MGNPLASVLKDKDFLAAHPDDQKAYLASVDKDFAAAKPEEQGQYLNHILTPSRQAQNAKVTQFERERPGQQHVAQPGEGFLQHVGSAVKGVVGGIASGAPGPGDVGRIAGQMAENDINRQREGRSLPYRIAAPIAGAVVPGLNPRAMEEAANKGDTSGILGEAAVPTAMAVAPMVKEGVGEVRGRVGEAIHTPEGELKPVAKAVGQIGGGAAGGAYGAIHGNPYAAVTGGVAGHKFGPSLMEGMFPAKPKPVFPGASLPSAEDFYTNKGAEMNAIRTKNEALAKQQAREAARQQKLQPIPTDTPTPISPGAALPSAEEFYAREGAERNAILARGEGAKPSPPEFPGAHLPSADEFYSKRGDELNAIRRRGTNPADVAPSVAKPRPQGPPTPGEGRPATWTNDKVRELASWGDPDAIEQARNRGFGKIPLQYSEVQTNPREVVHFGAEGKPITAEPKPLTATHQPEVARLEPATTEGPQPAGVLKLKGGINPKGVEASMRTISPEDMITGLSTEIERMADTLRKSPSRPESEKVAMQQQIDQYKQRLNELRPTPDLAAKRAERQRVSTLRSGRVF